jgi:hypothetical protein
MPGILIGVILKCKFNHGQMVDVIELPLKDTADIAIYNVDYKNIYDSIIVTPTDRVFILGFPLGLSSNPLFPIWKSGIIATEPNIDQENKPIIWVDDASYPGMSGSPVYYISQNLRYKYKKVQAVLTFGGFESSYFMGVFSHMEMHGVYGALWESTY